MAFASFQAVGKRFDSPGLQITWVESESQAISHVTLSLCDVLSGSLRAEILEDHLHGDHEL